MFDIPQSEQCILAAIMINPDCLKQIRPELSPEDFVSQRNRIFYRAMLDLDANGEPILPTSILDNLNRTKQTEKAGGGDYLADLLTNIHTSAGFQYHIKRVKANRIKTALLDISSVIADKVGTNDAGDLLIEAKERIAKIRSVDTVQDIYELQDLLPGVIDSIDRHETHSITTGLSSLDNLITGWNPGDLIIVAGRPGMGKSVLAKDFAESSKVPILFFSLEMPRDQLVKRQLSAHSGISYTSIRKSRVQHGDWPKLKQAADRLYSMPIAYSDKANMSVDELVVTCETRKRQEPLGLVIIDYLQLLRAEGKLEHREREVSTISQKLKTMARDMDIPVICLAQLNRSCELRGGDKKPMLSDLRESGSIEQDADTVIFIWREAMYRKTDINENEATLIVAKGRNTGTGSVRVYFDGKHQMFRDLYTYEEA